MTVNLIAGDDWEFRFTVLTPDGEPYDLTLNPEIKWTMLNLSGKRVIESDEVEYVETEPAAGKVSVQVPSTVTTRLGTAGYTHALRLVYAGVTATPFMGPLSVTSDPWAVETKVAALPGRSVIEFGPSQPRLISHTS